MRRTPVFEVHKSLNAKFTEFGGWEMPVQYSSIVKEHLAVRESVGLFDLSHMGEIDIKGNGAKELVEKLCTNDVNRLVDGQASYSLLCNENGGIVDDILVYRHSENSYTLVVNAGNIEKDLAWFRAHNDIGADVSDDSENTVLIAIQGPKSLDILNHYVLDHDISDISFFFDLPLMKLQVYQQQSLVQGILVN